jgi:hypothetical protein
MYKALSLIPSTAKTLTRKVTYKSLHYMFTTKLLLKHAELCACKKTQGTYPSNKSGPVALGTPFVSLTYKQGLTPHISIFKEQCLVSVLVL